MKKSIYNILIPVNRKYSLLYNSFTNKYLVLYSLHKEILDKQANLIKEDHSAFYSQLLDIASKRTVLL